MISSNRKSILWAYGCNGDESAFAQINGELLPRLECSLKNAICICSWSDPITLQRAVARFRPSTTIVLAHLADCKALMESSLPSTTINYWDLEECPISSAYTELIDRSSNSVVPSTYSLEIITKLCPRIKPTIARPGVDPNVFLPLDRMMIKSLDQLEGKFVVGFMGANNFESNIGALLEAFARFCTDKPDALLYICTDKLNGTYDIPSLVDSYGMRERCVLEHSLTRLNQDNKTRAERINSFDLLVFPGMSSSYNAVVLEAMSCGIPVVATNISSVSELLGDAGELVPVQAWLTAGQCNIPHAIVDTKKLAESLETMYADSAQWTRNARRARQIAADASWDACAESWLNVIHSTSGDRSDVILSFSQDVSNSQNRATRSIIVEPYQHVVCATEYTSSETPCASQICESNDEIKVVFRSPVFDASGYADESRSFLIPLSKRISHLRLDDTDWMPQRVSLTSEENAAIGSLRKNTFNSPYIEIVNNEPGMFKRNELACYRIGRTTFELDYLPPSWVEECNAMDEIWVTSAFCKDMFVKSGVAKDRLRVIPGPLDTRVFFAGNLASKRRINTHRPFRFLAVGIFIERKGWSKLLEAYAREFCSDDPVELVIRTFRADRSLEVIVEEMQKLLRKAERSPAAMPRIVVLEEDTLTREQMRNLYKSSDVLVAPTRGEGMGRPQLEALACGIPVITTAWGGQTDFVTDDNGWLVNYRLCNADPSDNPLFEDNRWADPDVDHLQHCMREAYENQDLRLLKGSKGPASVAKYDQNLIADIVVERLLEIHLEIMDGSFQCRPHFSAETVGKSWIMMTSPHEKCGIREYTSRLMDAGLGEHMTMISAPDLFRGFSLDAELIHVQFHAQYVNPHQFLHHTPKAKLIATVHETYRFDEISQLFDAIIVHNAKDYGKVVGMPRKEGAFIKIIPHGCCEPATDQYLIPTRTDPVIAFHGFAAPVKGLKELILGFSKFRKSHPNSRLLVVSTFNGFFDGRGRAYVNDCQRLVERLGLGASIDWVTDFLSLDDVVRILHERADMVVLPYLRSDDSGTSGAVRIAMAAGKPVIVSDIPLFYDVNEEVVKFPIADIDRLPQIIRSVWEDKCLQKRVVDRALNAVIDQPWSFAAQEVLAIQKNVIDGCDRSSAAAESLLR